MIVNTEAYSEPLTTSWITGLLPEGDQLQEMCRFYGIAQSDFFSLLSKIGWECAGAVAVLPEGQPQAYIHEDDYQVITTDELAVRLTALPARPYDNSRTLRVSLGGYQDKICVRSLKPGRCL